MNIGAGLAAVDGYFQAGEHAQDRDYLAKQRAFQAAQMQAGLDTLPDQTAADKARLGLSLDTSNAGRTVLPGQTANAVARQGLDSADLTFASGQQPVTQAITAGANRAALDNQPKQQAVATAALDRSVAQIPEDKKVQADTNATQATARHMQALVDLSRYLGANDKAGALAHVNAVADSESAQAGTRGKKFVDIVPSGEKTATSDNRAFDLVAEDGSKVSIPFAAMSQAQALSKTGKYTMHEGRAGDVHVLNENTGSLETKVPANPDLVRSASMNQHTPALLQIAHAYKLADPSLTETQALDKAKTSTEKPRHQAILDLVSKTAMPGQDMNKEYQKWADLYDKARGGAPSNSPAKPTIDPKFQNLFTP
ncbi:MAG: hypothetical protein V4631_20920 [Pseudomonadota bacterium]